MIAHPWLQVAFGVGAGAFAAWLFLRLLRASIDRLHDSPHPARALMGGFLLRAALVLAVFAVAARVSGGPGLIAALGAFLVVRSWRLRQVRRGEAGR